jgi:hypothetical protein
VNSPCTSLGAPLLPNVTLWLGTSTARDQSPRFSRPNARGEPRLRCDPVQDDTARWSKTATDRVADDYSGPVEDLTRVRFDELLVDHLNWPTT